jgi:SAM-dependent methyltransferase
MRSFTLRRFNSAEGVANYAAKFDGQRIEQIKNWYEQRLVARLLRSCSFPESGGRILDLPGGFGRFLPALRAVSPYVVESDWSWPMLQAAKEKNGSRGTAFVRASAVDLPFATDSFDLVFSVRLSHHFTTDQERGHYVRELFRVSRGLVLLSYLDAASYHHISRALGRRIKGKRPKSGAADSATIAATANNAGFEVVTSTPLSNLFSGQRYMLCKRVVEVREELAPPEVVSQPTQRFDPVPIP